MKQCPTCNAQNSDDYIFCQRCGARLAQNVPAAPVASNTVNDNAADNTMLFGILSIIGGLFMGLVGLILGIVGFSQNKKVKIATGQNGKGYVALIVGVVVASLNMVVGLTTIVPLTWGLIKSAVNYHDYESDYGYDYDYDNTNYETSVVEPEPDFISSSPFEYREEIDSQAQLYVLKENDLVSVFLENIQTGKQDSLFTFQDALKDYYDFDSQAPHLVLSPSKSKVAFVDREGLKIFNLVTRQTQTLISRSNDCPICTEDKYTCEITSVKWSIPDWSCQEGGPYNLIDLKWSADEQYLAFRTTWYEWTENEIFDLVNNKYIEPKEDMGSDARTGQFTWSNVGHQYAIYGVGMASAKFSISDQDNVEELTDLLTVVDPDRSVDLQELVFSTDGQRLALTFRSYGESTIGTTMAVMNIDGSGYKILQTIEDSDVEELSFSEDDQELYYSVVEDEKVTKMKYDLASGMVSEIL